MNPLTPKFSSERIILSGRMDRTPRRTVVSINGENFDLSFIIIKIKIMIITQGKREGLEGKLKAAVLNDGSSFVNIHGRPIRKPVKQAKIPDFKLI